VKIERLGNIVTTYASPDGTSWATLVVGRYDDLGSSPPTSAFASPPTNPAR
jgi:hypothetical protein